MKKAIPIKLMIFDLDGTIVDSAKDIILSVNATLKSLGLKEKSEDVISSYIGYGSVRLIADAIGLDDEKLISKGVDFYWDYYRKHSLDNTKLFPGTTEILEHFKEKRKVIVSNKVKEFVVHQLKAFKIERYFEVVVGGDDLKCAKPSPCPVNDILKQFNIQKNEAIMIGDMAIDIQTGKAAGIHTCAVAYGLGKKEDLFEEKPDIVISELSKLKELIK